MTATKKKLKVSVKNGVVPPSDCRGQSYDNGSNMSGK